MQVSHRLAALSLVPLLFHGTAAEPGIAERARLFHGLPNRILCAGQVCYAALDSGLAVLDASDPLHPLTIGSLHLPAPALDLALEPGRVFLAAGAQGMLVIDTSDIAAPRLLAALAVAGSAEAIALDDGFAAVGTVLPSGGGGALHLVAVGEPEHPEIRGTLALGNGVTAVALRAGVAHVGLGRSLGGEHGVVAVDVSYPAALAAIPSGFIASGLPVARLLIAGTRLYVGSGVASAGSIAVHEVSDAAAPRRLAATSLANGPRDLALEGSRLHVAVRDSGLLIFDVAGAGLARLGGTTFGAAAVTVAGLGSAALVGVRSSHGSAGIWALDTSVVSPARRVRLLGQSEATDIAAGSGLALLLQRDALHLYTTAAAGAPVKLSTWALADADYSRLDSDGRLAAVAEGNRVHLLDVTDATRPVRVALIDVGATVVRPRLHQDMLYIVHPGGLDVYDVRRAETPLALGGHPARTMATDVVIDGTIGYLLDGDAVVVLDLSLPAWPEEIASLVLPGEWLLGLDQDGPRLAVTGLGRMVFLIDVSDPAAPRLRGELPGHGFDVRVAGERAVIAAGEQGVRVLDITDLSRPVEIAAHASGGFASHLALDGATLLVAAMASQQWLLDCAACLTPPRITPRRGIEHAAIELPLGGVLTAPVISGIPTGGGLP